MRERTEKLGGELTISSVRGSGTLIKVVVPTAKLAV
jgi:signal transduction histidine kinase